MALRDRPDLTHYDPEIVRFWVARGGVGRREELTRRSALPIARRPFSWGEIRILDRLGVANAYLTFGGTVSAKLIDDVLVVVFESPVPLLRRGGHSQGWDEAAENVGAFFGRLKIAVDYVSGFEARFASASPEARYCAFIADAAERFRRDATRRDAQPDLCALVAAEAGRLAATHPDAVRTGRRLLDEIRTA